MRAHNDNFKHDELYAALDRATRDYNPMLLQGKLMGMLVDASTTFRKRGGQPDALVQMMSEYQGRPVDEAAVARNREIEARIGETLQDPDMARNYVTACCVAERANQLAEFIALGYDAGIVGRRDRCDTEKTMATELAKQMSDIGGIGPAQAAEKVRQYTTRIHETCVQVVGNSLGG